RGELDVALFTRDAEETGGVASWRECLVWVTSQRRPVDCRRDPLPLAVFEQGCLYHNRAIHALETVGRSWQITYTSPSILGIQAAVSAGLGIGILPEIAILPEHALLAAEAGFPPITDSALALVAAPGVSAAGRLLAEALADFCSSLARRIAV